MIGNGLAALRRKAVLLFGGALLLQTGGCALDVPGLLTSITTSIIGDFVFGAFNLGTF